MANDNTQKPVQSDKAKNPKQESSSSKTQSSPEKSKPASSKQTSSSILVVIAIVIAIVAIFEASYIWYRFESLHNNAENNMQTLKASTNQTQNDVTNIQTSIDKIQASIEQQAQQIESNQQDVTHLIKQNNASTESWTLQEVSHAIRLASLSLYYGHNIEAATTLLNTAAQRISDLKDPRLTKLHQSIVDMVLKLKSLPSINTTNIISRLSAINNQLPKLPLSGLAQSSSNIQTDDNSKTTKSSWTQGWRKALKQSWQEIEKVIVIRHNNQEIEPLITPEQQTNLIENIQIMISQAQWAVLRNNQALYQFSIQQANHWIAQYFDTQAPATQAVIKELIELDQMTVSPKLPDISSLQNELDASLKKLRNTNNVSSKPDQKAKFSHDKAMEVSQ